MRLIFLSSIILLFANCESKQNSPSEVVTDTPKTAEMPEQKDENKEKVILFFGNSLTAGYGLSPDQSFPSIIQTKIDSLDLDYKVLNGGLSGETTAGGVGRIDWVLRQKIDVFILELGGNDMLRGLDVEETEKNLSAIVQRVKAKYPDCQIIIAGMQAPTNLGTAYTETFNGLFQKIAATNNLGLIPFLLDGVAQIDSLNLPDGIHPNEEGQKIVAENVWKVLNSYL